MRSFFIILCATIPLLSFAQNVVHDLCGDLKPETLYNLEKKVKPVEHPWLASIVYSVLFGSTQEPSEVGLNCTATRVKKCPVTREIVHPVIVHPAYAPPSKRNDIALMRLEHPTFIWDAIRPLCLPTADVTKKDFVAQHLLAAGFAVNARRYTKLYVQIVDEEMCRMMYGGTEKYLCGSTCDNGSKFISGSALMGVQVKKSKADFYYLISMLAFVPEHCSDYKPDLFLRIDPYVEWIRGIII